jgi:WD40 repeat protein
MKRIWFVSFGFAAASLYGAPLPVAPVSHPAPVNFPSEVYPMLKANCIACHNKTTTKGGLNLETPDLMKKGGDSGSALEPGKGAESLLFQSAAHGGDTDMPPKGNKVGATNLTPEELGLMKLWIDQGAKPGEKISQAIAWKPLPPGLHPLYAVSLSAGGEIAACGRANHVFVYDLATRTQVAQWEAHRDMTLTLAFSPDGSRIASGSYGEVKVWKRSSTPLNPGPDARRLMDARAKVKQLERAIALAALDAAFHVSVVTAAAADITSLKDRVSKAQTAVTNSKKLLDEKLAALKPSKEARLAAQKALDELNSQVAALPADKPDAALTKKQTDAKTKLDGVIKAETEATEALKSAETSAKDAEAEVKKVTQLLAASEKALADAKAIQAAALQAQKKDSDDLASASKTLADTVKSLPALLFSPDQRWLIEPQADGSSVVWTVSTGVAAAKAAPKAGPKVTLTWKSNSQLAVPAEAALESLQSKWLLERSLGSGDTKSPIEDRVNAIAFSPDGKEIAVGSGEPSRGGDITFWEVASGKLVRALRDRHSDVVMSLDFSPDGKLIASGGADKQVRVSDVATGRQLKVFEGHTHHVMGVSWRADGRVLVSSGADNAAKVWDWIKGERRKNLDGWDKEVTAVHYLGASTRLVAASGDKQVRLIGEDGSSPAVLSGCTDFMQSCAASRDGRWTAAGGEDSVLRIWETKSGSIEGTFPTP